MSEMLNEYGHRWTSSFDGETVECQYCGDSYNSKRWCNNQLVVSDQDVDVDDQMSKYYEV